MGCRVGRRTDHVRAVAEPPLLHTFSLLKDGTHTPERASATDHSKTTLIIYNFILKTTLIIYNFILKTTLIIYDFANAARSKRLLMLSLGL